MDVRKQVMEKVLAWERRRIKAWQVIFWATIVALAGILIFSLTRVFQIIQNRGTFDLLTLFAEDREVIAEFWRDSLVTFYEELPHRRLTITILVATVIALVFLVTKKARKIIQKKLGQLKKYSERNFLRRKYVLVV